MTTMKWVQVTNPFWLHIILLLKSIVPVVMVVVQTLVLHIIMLLKLTVLTIIAVVQTLRLHIILLFKSYVLTVMVVVQTSMLHIIMLLKSIMLLVIVRVLTLVLVAKWRSSNQKRRSRKLQVKEVECKEVKDHESKVRKFLYFLSIAKVLIWSYGMIMNDWYINVVLIFQVYSKKYRINILTDIEGHLQVLSLVQLFVVLFISQWNLTMPLVI